MKRASEVFLALSLAWPLFAAPTRVARAADLVVVVEGVSNGRGAVLVAACTRETFLSSRCPWSATAPAKQGVVEVMLHGLPSGRHALQVFHDENGDGELGRASRQAAPPEGFGFGNDARMRFGPPRFDDASVEVSATFEELQRTRVRLRYAGVP